MDYFHIQVMVKSKWNALLQSVSTSPLHEQYRVFIDIAVSSSSGMEEGS